MNSIRPTAEELADDDEAKRLLNRARAVVNAATGATPDAQVAAVMRFLAMKALDRPSANSDGRCARATLQ